MTKYDWLVARIKGMVDHARKRQKTDVVFAGANDFWNGYLCALAVILEGEEMADFVADILKKQSEDHPLQ